MCVALLGHEGLRHCGSVEGVGERQGVPPIGSFSDRRMIDDQESRLSGEVMRTLQIVKGDVSGISAQAIAKDIRDEGGNTELGKDQKTLKSLE